MPTNEQRAKECAKDVMNWYANGLGNMTLESVIESTLDEATAWLIKKIEELEETITRYDIERFGVLPEKKGPSDG